MRIGGPFLTLLVPAAPDAQAHSPTAAQCQIQYLLIMIKQNLWDSGTMAESRNSLEPPQFSVMCGTELGWRAPLWNLVYCDGLAFRPRC